MKNLKYKLFAGSNYYPERGYQDFIDSFDTLEEAVTAGQVVGEPGSYKPGFPLFDWYQVVCDDVIVVEGCPERDLAKKQAQQ